jgi:hypothetical protein
VRRPLHLALAAGAILASCAGGDDSPSAPAGTAAPPTTQTSPGHPRDDELRLHHVQVLGTHNSYHVEPVPALAEALAGFDQELADSLAYTHRPLTEQLEDLGIRQIELDVFADPQGGRFAARPIFAALGIEGPPVPAAMREPGLKVFHVQEIDATSTCPTFTACLREVRSWSADHPGHTPVLVLVEAKDDAIPDPLGLGFAQPLPFDVTALDAVDAEIRAVFAEDEVLTPDDVRRGAPTLEEAVLSTGWPTLADVRGQVLFALDNTDDIRDRYVAGAPALAGGRCSRARSRDAPTPPSSSATTRSPQGTPSGGRWRPATWCAPGRMPTRCRPARATPRWLRRPSPAAPTS